MQHRGVDPPRSDAPADTNGATRWWDHRGVGALVVALVLVALSFLNDPGGYLGTDTGGKTATLEAMVDRGDWSPDVGYWAEDSDPDGRYHPLYSTQRTDEGWVQVTSLPMLYASRPLYEVGGYRAALLVPIAGTVLTALAAAALAERLADRRTGTVAFWIFGLGSPFVVYGLDLWEHSLGTAGIGWAAVLLFDAVHGRRGRTGPVAAGALLAGAATMRTEALVYTLVLVAGACLWLAAHRHIGRAVVTGIATVAGFAPVWLLNAALESAVGGNSRTSRATGTVEGAGGDFGLRLEEGIRTTFATAANDSWGPVAIGLLLAVSVAAVTSFGDRLDERQTRLVAAVLIALTAVVVAPGLGFVPGLFAAFPIAGAVLAVPRHRRSTAAVAVVAACSLPVVWAFQFTGGAGPQWAGRYVLPTTFLFGVVGVVLVIQSEMPRVLRRVLLAMPVVITVMGVTWLWERSHEIVDLFDAVETTQADALIARNPFLLREAGPRALEHRWLSAEEDGDVRGPAAVLRSEGIGRFSVLQSEGHPEPEIPGATVTATERITALGLTFEVVELTFDDR